MYIPSVFLEFSFLSPCGAVWSALFFFFLVLWDSHWGLHGAICWDRRHFPDVTTLSGRTAGRRCGWAEVPGLSLLMPLGRRQRDIAALLVHCLVIEQGPGHPKTPLLLLLWAQSHCQCLECRVEPGGARTLLLCSSLYYRFHGVSWEWNHMCVVSTLKQNFYNLISLYLWSYFVPHS